MSYLLGLLIIVGIVLAMVPMDATIRRVVVVITVVLAAVLLLQMLGVFP